MTVDNPSLLVAEVVFTTDPRGAETAVVVVKGTWFVGDGPARLAETQHVLRLAPEYRGAPGASSLRHDTDLVPGKPGTDCLLAGHAWGGGERTRAVRFAVRDGDRTCVEAAALALGPRQWQQTMGLASALGPLPFDRVELAWENAFGGSDATPDDPADHDACAENPVGIGFRARRSRRPVDGAWLPRVVRPDGQLDAPGERVRPVGFGPVAPGWEPRRSLAGTYDDGWRRTRAPLAPADFDPRFFQSAPPELVATPHLAGGEQVEVEGCGPRPWRFALPAPRVRAGLVMGPRPEERAPTLDTVRVDADAGTVEMVWRAAFDVHGRVDAVEGAVVAVDGL
jgi:hypothetical protein